MNMLKRIAVSLPMALGLGLFLSTSGELLDAYEASEDYREQVEPIVEAAINTGQVPVLTNDEKFDLRMDLPRAQMDRGTFENLRFRFYGGLILTMIGGLIAWRVDTKRKGGPNSDCRNNCRIG
ncbi:hypothetical protein [Haloferula sp. A504]|uniref:hypothetical protein n=1 Tax=Haloferula sp. A504 TaxID=3373601 RepID=UPI0031CA685D|nr:hypothetical protein [Verrucomicrobiaceae bacterium E54]